MDISCTYLLLNVVRTYIKRELHGGVRAKVGTQALSRERRSLLRRLRSRRHLRAPARSHHHRDGQYLVHPADDEHSPAALRQRVRTKNGIQTRGGEQLLDAVDRGG